MYNSKDLAGLANAYNLIYEQAQSSNADALLDAWLNSEHAPMDDEYGDDNTLLRKAKMFLAGQVNQSEIEQAANDLVDAIHA